MIIHVDMDAFYASVEIRDNPELVGKPVVVGGSPSGRGVICAASYEARKFGIYSAMPSREAMRKCPHLVFVKGRMDHYAAVSRQIREIFFSFTSLVEPLALDEAFLDVSGCERLFGSAAEIAKQIKQKVFQETQLIASAGVGPNKYVAKIASDLEKPDGLTVVNPDDVIDFLAPLSINRVWGVGPKTGKKFHKLGVLTIGQLQKLSLDALTTQLGSNAEHFHRLAHGIDSRPVVPDRVAKSVSHEHTFPVDIHDDEILKAWLLELADSVGRRLRGKNIFSKTIQLKLRYDDFETITRRKSVPMTHATDTLHHVACELLRGIRRTPNQRNNQNRGVRLIGLGAGNLTRDAEVQLSLFDQIKNDQQARVDEIADSIRDKFGKASLSRGSHHAHNVRFQPDPRIDNEP